MRLVLPLTVSCMRVKKAQKPEKMELHPKYDFKSPLFLPLLTPNASFESYLQAT